MELDEKLYKKYLIDAYRIKTGQKLNLRHPKTINEKIQWLKLYDNKPIKTTLTDKILVRDYVKEKIGDDYLKPILWAGRNFEDIPFNSMPSSFIIKTNHGCKWHFIIKDLNKFLNNNILFESVQMQFKDWLSRSFFGFSDFETQYKEIVPALMIEPLLRDESGNCEEIEVLCFNSQPKIIQRYKKSKPTRDVCVYTEDYKHCNMKFLATDNSVYIELDEILTQAVELSKKLSVGFKLVRIDWMVHKGKLYFQEMTFTPLSGYIEFSKEYCDWNLKLGNMLNLKGE